MCNCSITKIAINQNQEVYLQLLLPSQYTDIVNTIDKGYIYIPFNFEKWQPFAPAIKVRAIDVVDMEFVLVDTPDNLSKFKFICDMIGGISTIDDLITVILNNEAPNTPYKEFVPMICKQLNFTLIHAAIYEHLANNHFDWHLTKLLNKTIEAISLAASIDKDKRDRYWYSDYYMRINKDSAMFTSIDKDICKYYLYALTQRSIDLQWLVEQANITRSLRELGLSLTQSSVVDNKSNMSAWKQLLPIMGVLTNYTEEEDDD